MQKNGKKQSPDTLIGKGVRLVGLVEFEGNLHIYGRVEGDIVAVGGGPSYVYLGEDARVDGKVTATQMDVHGHIEGDIFCSERLMFGPESSSNGDVNYNSIQVEPGAQVSGRMMRAENPMESTSASAGASTGEERADKAESDEARPSYADL